MQVKKQQLEMDMEQQTGSKSGKQYVKAVYFHPAYLTYMQTTSCEKLGWMKHKLESRLLLLLLSRFSHVQLCATPQMAANQAPPSLGFSRQEYWSGLPFPSPESRLLGEISITSEMQMTPPLWQKVKKN